MKHLIFAGLFALLIIVFIPLTAVSADRDDIPSVLEPWEKWVLHEMEDHFCPTPYNNGSEFMCVWPSRLTLDLDSKGGQFSQQWVIYNDAQISLPGNSNTWPFDVKIDGREVPVISVRGIPSVFIKAGKRTINGRFMWNDIPEMINIPEKSGLVTLKIDKEQVKNPLLDNAGRLWLQNRKGVRAEEDRHDVKMFRMIEDDIPVMIHNLIRLYVSGQAREIRLEGVLFRDTVPVKIKSPLPVLVGENREILIQARPGQWDINIITRSSGPIDRLGPFEPAFGQEIWAFSARNHLRMVKIEGVPAIDPGQTELPSEWKGFPSYLINAGDTMEFKEVRRGDPDPAPDQIQLQRTWWLDFDGRGYTIKDNISGTMSRQWFLAVNPPTMLGRVSIDGADQLITGHGSENKSGVELRKGYLNLESESRLERTGGVVPAVGWDHDMQSLSGTLNLPPGWRLFAVNGVDSMHGTWLQKWNLLDLFLVLIISVAVFKLWTPGMGLLSLITLILIYHEPGSPRIVWIHILAATALLRFFKEGWFNKILRIWRVLFVIVLLVITIPFIVQQARLGIYPQLEPGAYSHAYMLRTMSKSVGEAPALEMERQRIASRPGVAMEMDKSAEFALEESRVASYKQSKNIMLQDPNALIQTGPGLLKWQWNSFPMQWNGPVDSDQKIRLWLVSPFANMILAFIRIILLAVLALFLTDLKGFKISGIKKAIPSLLVILIMIPGLARAETATGAYPPAEILAELKERLLEKPECLPFCADSPSMKLYMEKENLRIVFRVHVVAKTAVPLPGSSDMWRPDAVMLDSVPADVILRDNKGTLWILAPEGIHDVILSGGTMPGNELQISFPMRPHKVSIEGKGWSVQGIDREGRVEGSIRLIRIKEDKEETGGIGSTVVPPFYHVERVLSLGLDWQVITTVNRITNPDSPVVVSVPLINGESVITGGIRVEEREAVIHMAAGVSSVQWTSTLKPDEIISLKAPESVPWTETWILDASPIWHCEFSGIPLIHHQDNTGQWRPEWKPWWGEEASIRISRPEAIPGRSLTVDNVSLRHTPGKRISRSVLDMTVRSSQGGQHKITLPEGAKLQSVTISGRSQPISQQDRVVSIPVNPGSQDISLEWQKETSSMTMTLTPQADIGAEAVNADVYFEMPRNRWILLAWGPRLGPAVLFWSYLIVIILAGILLGKVKITPLKTGAWLLLGLGLTQVSPLTAIIIAGWFLIMGIRKGSFPVRGNILFNLSQLVLVIWFISAMIGIWFSIKRGLLGIPDMQIAGNGSTDFLLHWTQDRISSLMPECGVLSLNIYVFKGLMLLWALWLSYSLILKWLPWAWGCFNDGGIWKKNMWKKEKKSGMNETGTILPENEQKD